MFGHQHLAMGPRLIELLLQFVQGLAQVVRFVLLVFGLRSKSRHQLIVAQRALECRARQVVVSLLHGQFRLGAPLGRLVLVLGPLFSSRC